MTNSINKMAGKNSMERNSGGGGSSGGGGTSSRGRTATKARPTKVFNATYFNSGVTQQNCGTRVSPATVPPSSGYSPLQQQQHSTPRTSPVGLAAGYFAGGKWTEPPLPKTLPKPPQHWTQLVFSAGKCSAAAASAYISASAADKALTQQTDIASQLKVLLNVQA